jgi:hypothetical protein
MQAGIREPLIQWERPLLEEIGPYFKARAKRQYPSWVDSGEEPKEAGGRVGLSLIPQARDGDAPSKPPCPQPLLSATKVIPIESVVP